MRKELTMCMVELLQASRPLLKVFPEAGRRARSLHDLYAKVEELAVAAEEAKKAGEHAKAMELAKQAEERLSTFEEGHEYTTLADHPDQWKLLRAVDYKGRVILPRQRPRHAKFCLGRGWHRQSGLCPRRARGRPVLRLGGPADGRHEHLLPLPGFYF